MDYKGKLLLFGEHIVVQGAQALAIPLQQFSGHWSFDVSTDRQLHLREWLVYLDTAQKSGTLGCTLDLPRFEQDLDRGLFFESNIPLGYGAGSSGALCAALYDTYAQHPIDKENQADYPLIRTILGNMESFFHGASSGADPIVSYLNRPLLFDHAKAIKGVALPEPHPDYTIFLLDTGHSRKTGPLVEAFRGWCTDPDYLARVLSELIPSTEDAIHYYLTGQWDALYEEWGIISHFQYRFMQEMILPDWRSVWLDSLAEAPHRLKICGAGGGGFILGLSRNWHATQRVFGDAALRI